MHSNQINVVCDRQDDYKPRKYMYYKKYMYDLGAHRHAPLQLISYGMNYFCLGIPKNFLIPQIRNNRSPTTNQFLHGSELNQSYYREERYRDRQSLHR